MAEFSVHTVYHSGGRAFTCWRGAEAASCCCRNAKQKQSMLALEVGLAAGALCGVSENILRSSF